MKVLHRNITTNAGV